MPSGPITRSEAELLEAEQFDVRNRFFANVLYSSIDPTGFTRNAAPTGWYVSGDTITPSGTWVEVTNLINANRSIEINTSLNGSSITWNAKLSGYGYNEGYFGIGRAILCMTRTSKTSEYSYFVIGQSLMGDQYSDLSPNTVYGIDSGWVLDWMGVVINGEYNNDYRNGAEWTRSVGGVNNLLSRINAPRKILTPYNIASGKSVDASTTLVNAYLEARNKEFIGTTATVSPSNVTDENIRTPWISDGTPSTVGDTEAKNAGAVISEIMLIPAPGWNQKTAWWFEINAVNGPFTPNHRSNEGDCITFTNSRGQVFDFRNTGWTYDLAMGHFGVVCSDRKIFNAYTGGRHGVDWVYDLSTANINEYGLGGGFDFWLNPESDYITVYSPANLGMVDVVAWSRDGSVGSDWGDPGHLPSDQWGYRVGSDDDDYYTVLDQAISLNDLGYQPGNSIKRKNTNYDTNRYLDWELCIYPTPGTRLLPQFFEWLHIDLGLVDTTITADSAAGATQLQLSDTIGWTTSGYNYGIVEGEIFSYTGIDGTSLVGIPATGELSLKAPHSSGAICTPAFPADLDRNNLYPVRFIKLMRRDGLPTIFKARIFVSKYEAPTMPDINEPWQVAWMQDWDEHIFPIFSPYIALQTGSIIIVEAAPGDTTLTLKDASLWSEAGTAVFAGGGETFTWSGKSGNTLTGVDGIVNTHYASELVVIYTPGPMISVETRYPYANDQQIPFTPMRHILICIDEMSDKGRAKLNELQVIIDSGIEDDVVLGSITSGTLIHSLLASVPSSICTVKEVITEAINPIGMHATAIAPYTDVIDAICSSTGQFVFYGYTGEVEIFQNPWWPTSVLIGPRHVLGDAARRGSVAASMGRSEYLAVALNVSSPDRTRSWREVYPRRTDTVSYMTKEVNGIVLDNEILAKQLAEMFYYIERNNVTLEFEVKGIARWLTPGQWISVQSDIDPYLHIVEDFGSIFDRMGLVVESVSVSMRYTEDKSQDGAVVKECRTRVGGRRFPKRMA